MRVEDLKQPPPKRIKTGTGASSSFVTSPDRLHSAGAPSPSAPELFNSLTTVDAALHQLPNEPVSPAALNSKSPGSKAHAKRNQASRGATSRGGRKSSTQTSRTTKPSHQIMAEVKAEHAAAKAKRDAEKMEQGQATTVGTPSVAPSESNENQSENNPISGADKAPEGGVSHHPEASTSIAMGPVSFSTPASSKPQADALPAEKPPQVLIEELLKEFWSDSLSSAAPASTSTNTLDDDGWRGLMADLKLPIACDPEDETSRAREDEILGSWLLEEEFARSKGSPSLGDMTIDMMHVGPAIAHFFESVSPTEATSAKHKSDGRNDNQDKASVESKEGMGPTRWKNGSMSDFLCDANQSVLAAPDESSPPAPVDGRTRAGSNGQKFGTGTVTETPEFSPSKLSNDSTPESVCSTEGHSVNPKGLVSASSMHTTASESSGLTNDAKCYSNVDEEDALLMFMMGLDDDSTIGAPASSANGSQSGHDKKQGGVGQFRVREGSGGFTGLDSRSVLSDEFWSRPFVTSSGAKDLKGSNGTTVNKGGDDELTELSSSAGASGSDTRADHSSLKLAKGTPGVQNNVLNSSMGGIGVRTGENQEALTVK